MSIYRVDIEDNKPVSASYIGNFAGNDEVSTGTMEENGRLKSLYVFAYDEEDSREVADEMIHYFL